MKTSAVDSPQSSRRLKVAVLNRIFVTAGGGAERYSIAVVEQLAARHEIHVFAQEIDHQWPGVTYHRISCLSKRPRWLNQLWYAYATWRATRTGFDIVHSHENVWHGNVQTMHVKTVKRSLLQESIGWRRVLRRLVVSLNPRHLTYTSLERSRMAPGTDKAVVAVSQPLRDELITQYPHCSTFISVITPGVAVPNSIMGPDAARQALGIPAQGRYILFVANDYARKGLASLLEAVGDMDDVTLLVVGNPGQSNAFKTKIQALGMQQRVYFLGSLQNMSTAYFAADVLAHPTLEDSFAMVVLEAMAHGLPVVVSGAMHCGIASLLTDGIDALLLKNPLDVLSLRTALQRVLGSTITSESLVQAGKVFVQTNSWAAVARSYDFLYQKCVLSAVFSRKNK
jgi:glycosyltransferase involved in cell wall biosynthesis